MRGQDAVLLPTDSSEPLQLHMSDGLMETLFQFSILSNVSWKVSAAI